MDNSSTHLIFYWGISEFSASVYGKILTYLVFFIRDFLFLGIKVILNLVSVYAIRQHLKKVNECHSLNISVVTVICKKKSYVNETEKSLTKMVIVATLFSIMENIFFAVANGYYLIAINKTSGYLILVSYVAVALKHGSNFFLFICFNRSFHIKNICFVF